MSDWKSYSIEFLYLTHGKILKKRRVTTDWISNLISRWIFISAQGLFSKHLSYHKNLPEIKGIVVLVLVYVDCDCRPVFSPLIKLFNFSDWIWNWVSPQPSPLTGLSLVIANTVLLKDSTKQIQDKNLRKFFFLKPLKSKYWVLTGLQFISFNSVIIEDCWDPLSPSSLLSPSVVRLHFRWSNYSLENLRLFNCSVTFNRLLNCQNLQNFTENFVGVDVNKKYYNDLLWAWWAFSLLPIISICPQRDRILPCIYILCITFI